MRGKVVGNFTDASNEKVDMVHYKKISKRNAKRKAAFASWLLKYHPTTIKESAK